MGLKSTVSVLTVGECTVNEHNFRAGCTYDFRLVFPLSDSLSQWPDLPLGRLGQPPLLLPSAHTKAFLFRPERKNHQWQC